MKSRSAQKGLLQNGLAVTDGDMGTGRTIFLHLLLLSADLEVTCEEDKTRQVAWRHVGHSIARALVPKDLSLSPPNPHSLVHWEAKAEGPGPEDLKRSHTHMSARFPSVGQSQNC